MCRYCDSKSNLDCDILKCCKRSVKLLNTINETTMQDLAVDQSTNTIVSSIPALLTGTPKIKAPKLTIVLVTEHFGYNELEYLAPNFRGGLKTLLDNGIVYTNATYPNDNCGSASGHATLASGALAQIHGLVNNGWGVKGQTQFTSSDYSMLSGASLAYVANTSYGNSPGQTYPRSYSLSNGFGCANRNMLADTLSDQMEFFSTPASTKQFYWVAPAGIQGTTAYIPAGQLGKPFTFDYTAGGYTSSQAFFPSAMVAITDAAQFVGIGSLSGNTLTITAVGFGALVVGQTIEGAGSAPGVQGVTVGTIITAFGTGVGGVGTYTVNQSQIVTSTSITARQGRGATANARVVNGVIQEIIVSNPGINYANPTISIIDVTTDIKTGTSPFPSSIIPVKYPNNNPSGQVLGIQGNGSGATATPTVVGGQITSITVNTGGTGYHGGLPSWVTTWNNAQNFDTLASWTQNTTYPIGDPAYNLPNIGNYSGATKPSIIGIPQIIPQPGTQPLTRQVGSGATALATVQNGVITAITVTNGGSGYTAGAGIGISGITYKGVPASATVTVVAGVVTAITVTNGGSGYVNPVVAIVGRSQPGFATNPFSFATSGYAGSATDGIQKQFSFIEALLDANLQTTDELVVFVNMGTVLGNADNYGLLALDSVDSVYHLDQLFGAFITNVYKKVDPSDVLLGWVSDEGSSSGELAYWAQAGYANAVSNDSSIAQAVINAINGAVSAAYPAVASSYTASISGTTMTVSAIITGSVAVGQVISGTGVTPGTTIIALGTGTGDIGTYFVNQYQTVAATTISTGSYTGLAAITSGGGNTFNNSDIWFAAGFFRQSPADQANILQIAKNAALTVPYIKSVYTQQELLNSDFEVNEEDKFLKQELFPVRSGQLKYNMQPMSSTFPINQGDSPSNWSYRVPLVLYQPGQLENKTIVEPVYINQLSLTLAELLKVPRPIGAPREMGPLPGIFTNFVTY
jgi:uncharacterized protein YdbL (DUF1318 family)